MTLRNRFRTAAFGSVFVFLLAAPVVAIADAVPCAETTDSMHARYYSPNLGRFVSVDPVGGRIGSSQSWNRYSYALNNPIAIIDPDGRANLMALSDQNATRHTSDSQTQAYRQEEQKVLAVSAGVVSTFAPGPDDALMAVAFSKTAMRALGSAGRFVKNLFSGADAATDAATPLLKAGDEVMALPAKTTSGMAEDLANTAGRNRVSAQSSGQRTDIDLQGKSHYDKATGQEINTPHVHETELHTGSNGQVNTGTTTTRPATTQDVRTAKKILENTSSD